MRLSLWGCKESWTGIKLGHHAWIVLEPSDVGPFDPLTLKQDWLSNFGSPIHHGFGEQEADGKWAVLRLS